MKIVILGSGNVATVLGRKIQLAGHEILQVVSPNLEHAKVLGEKLGCEITNDFNNTHAGAELYLLALSDWVLERIHEVLQLHRSLAVHTAGSVSKSVLKKVSSRYGVMYPLQSLRGNLDLIPEIPLLVDGNTPETIEAVEDFARSISTSVNRADDKQRLKLHVAAVVSANFTNYLFALAQEYCHREKVDFRLLMPLIMETVNRLQVYSAATLQTGPAVRNDSQTIRKHLSLLKKFPALRKIYRQLSISIRNYFLDNPGSI